MLDYQEFIVARNVEFLASGAPISWKEFAVVLFHLLGLGVEPFEVVGFKIKDFLLRLLFCLTCAA